MFISFTASGDVHRHKVVHTGEKPHLCDICGRGKQLFKIKPILLIIPSIQLQYVQFLLTAIQESNINTWLTQLENCDTHFCLTSFVLLCSSYGAGFNNLSNLKEHKRTHATDKTFTCDQCGKSFNTQRKLLKHKARHTGEKPHSCATCGKRHFLPGWKYCYVVSTEYLHTLSWD